jgi:putative zinc finger/helix-turn-helix YgiT family protein
MRIESEEKETCLICASDTAHLVTRPFPTKYRNVPVTVQAEMYRCDECGEEFSAPDQARELSRKVKAAAREKLGLLPSERIIEIRRKYNLSQEKLETLLGLGPKEVTRWENDRVLQSKAIDDLLRLMERIPAVVEELPTLRGHRPGYARLSA